MTTWGIILGLLPGFAWLLFYLREDLHPEPKRLIVLTFLSGIAFGFYALFVENFLSNVFLREGFFGASSVILPVLMLAVVEEVFKFGAAYFIVYKNKAFNEPVDAMVYTVIAALGFATLENLGALNFSDGAQTAMFGHIFQVASLRFVGATLLHSLTSAIAGYYWAISIRDFGAKRYLFFGLLIASGLHAIFNYLIIKVGTMVYPLLLVLVVGFFVINDFEKLKRRTV